MVLKNGIKNKKTQFKTKIFRLFILSVVSFSSLRIDWFPFVLYRKDMNELIVAVIDFLLE